MSSFRKPIFLVVCLVLLFGTGAIMAQPSINYGAWPTQLQTRNIPAGTVHDPGSQALYYIDTGVNLREAVGADLTGYDSSMQYVDQGDGLVNPFGVGGDLSIYNGDPANPAAATLDTSKVNQNFITITNTHPTQAVTVHFRYFNDECIDVLDFLVLLTCNDTLIFDPFNFNIPKTSFNTRTRIFGPAQGLFAPIRAADFASGRFLIFGTAAGTSYEPANMGTHDDNAELRFPAEFDDVVADDHHCDNLQDDTYFGLNPGLRADNLHVFNSSAVAFNYLIGSWATSRPADAEGVVTYGLEALVRPAVDRTVDSVTGNLSFLRGYGDGDGPALLDGNDFRILTGTEVVLASNQINQVQPNSLYLAQRTHGGDTAHVNDINGDTVLDYDSWYGALGLTSLFGANPDNQAINFLSIVDDYNGSRHATDTPVANFVDRSYNLNGARTVYVLQIYNNDEILFDVEADTPINISPPPFETPTAILKITVDCLRVWLTDVISDSTSVDDLQISDLFQIADGLEAFLTAPVDGQVDASQGWIRFVRDNSITSATNSMLYGTWVLAGEVHDAADTASFVTDGFQVVSDLGRGAAWWLFTVASNPLVSDTGDPQCDGACPNPTQQ